MDSDVETVRMIGNVLKDADYQVNMAYNSTDAIHSIENIRPDLIVLNPTAPDVGLDVVEYLKTVDDLKDIPLVIVTNKVLTEKEIDDLNGRIQGILNRGILTKEDLLHELKHTINNVNK